MPPPLMEVGAFSSVTSCGWDSLGRWSPVFGWGRSIVEAPSSGAFDGDVERHREGAAFGRGSPDSATTSSALVRLGRSVSFFGRARGDTAARSSCEATHGDMGRRGAVDLLRGDVCTARLREGQRAAIGTRPWSSDERRTPVESRCNGLRGNAEPSTGALFRERERSPHGRRDAAEDALS